MHYLVEKVRFSFVTLSQADAPTTPSEGAMSFSFLHSISIAPDNIILPLKRVIGRPIAAESDIMELLTVPTISMLETPMTFVKLRIAPLKRRRQAIAREIEPPLLVSGILRDGSMAPASS